MNNPTYEFKLLPSVNGYRVVLPGNFLQKAKTEKMSVPLEDGGSVSLSEANWYDQFHLSMDDTIYSSIKSVDFEPTAEYSVFFINKQVTQPYLFAVKLPI